MSTLIVTLPWPAAPATGEIDYVLSPDGRTPGTHGQAAPALLPQPGGAGSEVVAVVPAQALAWHRLELPKGTTPTSPRLRAILEGMLEDRLLDEPEAVHFAVQPGAVPGSPIWVAVCDRAWLRAAVQTLESAQRPATRIVPEFSPGEPVTATLTGDPERAVLVLTSAGGVMAWPVHGTAALPPLPEDLTVLAEPAVAALAEQRLHRKVQLQQATTRQLLAAQSAWDLAQLDFASSGRARWIKRLSASWAQVLQGPQWRAARWGAGLLLLAQLAGLNAWAWKEKSVLDDKRNAIRTTLTSTFPSVKVVVDPPLQMEREVAALRQATGAASGRDLESMLASFSAAAPANAAPSAIEFVADEVRIKGVKFNGNEGQSVAAAMQGRGYSLRSEADVLVIRLEGGR